MSKNINIVTSEEMIEKHQINTIRQGLSKIAEEIAMLSHEINIASIDSMVKLQPKIAKAAYRMSIIHSSITDLCTLETLVCKKYYTEGGI